MGELIEDIKLWTVVAIPFILFLGFMIIIVFSIFEANESVYDQFCQDKGFEEATDYNIDSNIHYVDIECDKDNIFFDRMCVEGVKCLYDEKDKWGNCVFEERFMECD